MLKTICNFLKPRHHCDVTRIHLYTCRAELEPVASDKPAPLVQDTFSERRTYPKHDWLREVNLVSDEFKPNPDWLNHPISQGRSIDYPKRTFEVRSIAWKNGTRFESAGDQLKAFDSAGSLLGSYPGKMIAWDCDAVPGRIDVELDGAEITVIPGQGSVKYDIPQEQIKTIRNRNSKLTLDRKTIDPKNFSFETRNGSHSPHPMLRYIISE